MLLAIDAGNTNIVFGLCEAGRIVSTVRAPTYPVRHSGQYINLLDSDFDLSAVTGTIVSSVVPALEAGLRDFGRKLTGRDPVFITHKNAGIEIDMDRPEEVGPDRLVNAAAVLAHYRAPAIVVDFGTATTFDVIDAAGRYIGGAIAPGINLSLAALHQAAARLPEIAVAKPERVIGKSTVPAMQSGIYWGYVGLIEGLAARIAAEMGVENPFVLATGGLAPLFAGSTPLIHAVDEHLTLKGLIKISIL